MLKYQERTPTLAMCRRCKVKFFAVHASVHDPIGAEQYLWARFAAHNCRVQAKVVTTGRKLTAPAPVE